MALKTTLPFALSLLGVLTSSEYLFAAQPSHVPLFVKVKNHFDTDGGGEESSGYHALKNGLILAHSLTASQGEQQKIQAQLTDSSLVRELFATKTSVWKEVVINHRRDRFAIEFIIDTLLTALRGAATVLNKEAQKGLTLQLLCDSRKVALEPLENQDQEKERALLIALLQEIGRYLTSTQQPAVKGIQYHYSFSQETIFKAILHTLNSEITAHSESPYLQYYQKLADPEYLKSYFPHIASLDFLIEGDNILITTADNLVYKRNYDTANGNAKKPSEPGAWLSKNELALLYSEEIKRGEKSLLPNAQNVLTFCISDLQLAAGQKYVLDKKLSAFLKKLHDPDYSCVAIFFIQYLRNWCTCVVSKNKETTHYVFADSALYNSSQSKEFTSLLLSFLTGKEPVTEDQPISLPKMPALTAEDAEKKAEEVTFKESTVTRDDYAGTLPQPVDDVIDVLKNGKVYRSMGMTSLPTMMLLYGPPGTGKTTLARLIAHQTGRLYTEVIGSTLLNKYYGEGVKKLKKVFESARQQGQPVLIFIDEIDAILATSTKEKQRTDLLQVFNNELDKKDPNIFVVGATNRYGHIDSTTKSRCRNYCLEIPLPDTKNREVILKHYLAKVGIENDGLARDLASRTNGFSGRELEIMLNQSVVIAYRKHSEQVEANHLFEALEKTKIEIGKEKKEESKKDPLIDYKNLFRHTVSAVVSHMALSAIIGIGSKAYEYLKS